MLTLLSYIFVGLLGGVIAKSLMGEKKTSWLNTVLLGISGALLAGFLGGWLLNISYRRIFSISGVIMSVLGAILILAINGWLKKK